MKRFRRRKVAVVDASLSLVNVMSPDSTTNPDGPTIGHSACRNSHLPKTMIGLKKTCIRRLGSTFLCSRPLTTAFFAASRRTFCVDARCGFGFSVRRRRQEDIRHLCFKLNQRPVRKNPSVLASCSGVIKTTMPCVDFRVRALHRKEMLCYMREALQTSKSRRRRRVIVVGLFHES